MNCKYFFFIPIFIFNISFSLNFSEIDYSTVEEFNGNVDDRIESYHYSHEYKSIYFLNNSLQLNIIDLELNKISKIQLNTNKNFIETLPNNWVPNINMIANKEIVDTKVLDVVYNKLANCNIILNDNELYLVDNGGGLVFKINLKNYSIARDDSSFPTMNKFGGDLFNYKNEIYHFGGYGLYTTNSTLLRYNRVYKNWDEIVTENRFPIEDGITNTRSLIRDNKYYIFGGNSTRNEEFKFNNSLIYFDFNTNEWTNLGLVNYDLNEEDLLTSNGDFFFIYNNNNQLVTINVENLEIHTYKILENKYFSNNWGSPENIILFNCNHIFQRNYNQSSIKSESNKNSIEKNTVNYFVANNSTYMASIFKSYSISEFVDLNSKKNGILFKDDRSRKEFLIPIIIVISILILNFIYKTLKKNELKEPEKLYSYEDGILYFKQTEISIDNNTKDIIELLIANKYTTSNDIVAKLVENGISFDYASKIKNKTIEKLNDKFQFITGTQDKFIESTKSKEDKRIQVLKLISKKASN